MKTIFPMENNKRSPTSKAHLVLTAVHKHSRKQAGIGRAVQEGKRGKVWARIWASIRFMPKAQWKRRK